MKKDKLTDYQAVIFDLDGTLYYQKPFRRHMMRYLLSYMLKHPASLKDLYIIYQYRKLRENWEKYDKTVEAVEEADLDTRQYQFLAEKMKISPEAVKKAVAFFMLEAPLSILPAYRDEELVQLIEVLKKKNRKIVVYSDYPVKDKLKVLKIEADWCFTSADPEIASMKPNPKGLWHILKELQCDASDAIMIGDRFEKDGLAAQSNHMDYLILPSSRKERNHFLKNLSI